jgi:hypothetical protein
VGCCRHHYHGPWCWGDWPEFGYELRPRRRESAEPESEALRDLRERQRELEAELAALRERIREKAQ